MSESPQKRPASSFSPQSSRRITIVGAGIAGLTLACILQKQNIPFNIYEARNATTLGHSYSITLFRRPWRNLLHNLSSKYATLREDTAADRFIGGTGKPRHTQADDSTQFQAVDRDVRLWLVQRLQEKGIQINWDHKLSNISKADDGKGAFLSFEKGQTVETDIIVDAGGLRSPAFENHLNTAPKARLLSYATYYGSRRMKASDFSQNLEHYFRTGNMIELVPETPNLPYIQVKKVHLPMEDNDSGDHSVELRWIFSRPARQGKDPLYRPNRTPEEAKNIPDELYDEILSSIVDWDLSKKQRSMLTSIFNLSDLHDDRILNWHLRLRLPPPNYFVENTNHGTYQVIAIGDAAHGLPIVESTGAGNAARDAMDLARWLQRLITGEPPNSWEEDNFYKRSSVSREWLKQAVRAVQRLRTCHGQSLLSRTELEEITGYWVDGVVEEGKDTDSTSSSSDIEESQRKKGRL